MRRVYAGLDAVAVLTDAAVRSWWARWEGNRWEVIGAKSREEERVAAAAGYGSLDGMSAGAIIEPVARDRVGAVAVAVKVNGIA